MLNEFVRQVVISRWDSLALLGQLVEGGFGNSALWLKRRLHSKAAEQRRSWTPTSQRVLTRPDHDVKRLPGGGGVSSVASA